MHTSNPHPNAPINTPYLTSDLKKSPSPSIIIKPTQLLPRILHILLRLHPHVEDRAILTAADDLAMHTALTPLTLGPQPAESDFQLADLAQGLRVEFPDPGSAVLADRARHFLLGAQGFLAAHARLSLLREFHEPAGSGRRDGDGACVFARQELTRLFLPEDGIEDSSQRFGELVVEIIFRVDWDVVLEDVDWIF